MPPSGECPHCKEVLGELKKLNHLITGNGEPEEGILFRLVTLERKAVAVARLLWGILGGIGFTAGAWIWARLTGGGNV